MTIPISVSIQSTDQQQQHRNQDIHQEDIYMEDAIWCFPAADVDPTPVADAPGVETTPAAVTGEPESEVPSRRPRRGAPSKCICRECKEDPISKASHRRHTCPFCPDEFAKPFVRAAHLKRHIKRVHDHMRPHKCSYSKCAKAFATKTDCQRHEKIHIDAAANPGLFYPCPTPGCQHVSKRKYLLARHRLQHLIRVTLDEGSKRGRPKETRVTNMEEAQLIKQLWETMGEKAKANIKIPPIGSGKNNKKSKKAAKKSVLQTQEQQLQLQQQLLEQQQQLQELQQQEQQWQQQEQQYQQQQQEQQQGSNNRSSNNINRSNSKNHNRSANTSSSSNINNRSFSSSNRSSSSKMLLQWSSTWISTILKLKRVAESCPREVKVAN